MTAPLPDWPVTMPGAADDPRGARGQAAAQLDSASRDLVQVSELDAAPLSTVTRQLARQARDAIGQMRQHVHSAAGQLDALAGNDLIPDRARERLARETHETAGRALRDLADTSGTALDMLEAALTVAAQPAFPAGADRGEAREEFRLIVDAATDPGEKVRELATGSDQRLAALAAGSYGQSYLRSRGVPDDVIRATAAYAAQAALNSGDPTREAAARALVKVDTLRKARMKSLAAANFAIGWQ